MSVRTSYDIDLSETISKLGYGGGHKNACGVKFDCSSLEKKLEVINEIDNELIRKYSFLKK
jgi:nanoRNase/pAp phosphatase (c-di-AMP/oligoRNAs hydrolase)